MGNCCRGFGWGGIGRGMMGWGGMGLFSSILGLLLFLGLLVALVFVAVWLIRRLGRNSNSYSLQPGEADLLTLARRRLATGEITVDEFEEIRSRLEV